MKILVISGFLGAGKTTFIQELVEHSKSRFVVLENEYGDQDIDGDILKESTEIWEMTEGCICCSMRSDFASSVLTIANTLDPDFLIVEPTGVGLLSNVLQNIRKVEYDRIRLLPPLTLVDMEAQHDFHENFTQIFEDQVASAGLVLITKSEEYQQQEIETLACQLEKLGQARVERAHYSTLPQSWWDALLQAEYNGGLLFDKQVETPDLEYVSFLEPSFSSIQQFKAYLDVVMRGEFGSVVRGKGFLELEGRWGKFDLVGKKYTLSPCEPMPEAKFVLIGKDLDREKLAVLLGAELHVT